MGLVDRFERKLESTVGDAFARVFGGSIVPQEVEAMLRSEKPTPAHAKSLGGRILAPNDYVITLSVPDYQKVSADPDLTSTTFAKHLEGYIHEQGWQTYGDVVVRFEPSPNLHTGQFRARGAVNPDSTTGEPAPPPRERSSNAEPGVPHERQPELPRRPGTGAARRRVLRRAVRPPAGRAPRSARPVAAAGQGGYPPQGAPSPATRRGRAATPTRAATRSRAATPTRATRRRPTSSARPPATARRRGGGYPDQGYRQAPGRLRPPPQGGGQQGYGARRQATTTTAVSPPHRGGPTRAATAASRAAAGLPGPGRLPRPGRLPGAGRLRRPGIRPSGLRAARLRPLRRARRPAAATPNPAMPSPRAAGTTTASPPARPAATAAVRPGRLRGRRRRPSRCSSTTAAAAPTSCARAPT